MSPWIAVVGGFLGAGKTTLILRAAKMLAERGVRSAVILNDQGEDLVDTELARARGFAAEQVTGGCFCCRYPDLVDAVDRLQEFDVIFAEPVGSCTDVASTVVGPLLATGLRVAPFTVVVDPGRELTDENVGFLVSSQLAEADIVCVSKSDVAPESGIRGRRVSGKTGQGVAEWLDELFAGTMTPGERILDLDYERYAAAETALTWLDARLIAELDPPLSPAMLIGPMIERLNAGLSILHLKVIDRTAGSYLKAAITGKGSEAVIDGNLASSPASRHDLLLNIRALDSPESLERAVRKELPGGGSLNLKCFRPNVPVRRDL
jgi:Ni2+-binding GTPase involved in maturation of urease and hydrogenase